MLVQSVPNPSVYEETAINKSLILRIMEVAKEMYATTGKGEQIAKEGREKKAAF
jgi:hypothetical protein